MSSTAAFIASLTRGSMAVRNTTLMCDPAVQPEAVDLVASTATQLAALVTAASALMLQVGGWMGGCGRRMGSADPLPAACCIAREAGACGVSVMHDTRYLNRCLRVLGKRLRAASGTGCYTSLSNTSGTDCASILLSKHVCVCVCDCHHQSAWWV